MTKSTPQKLKYQKEYNARPEEVAKRVKNNAARREAIKEGKAKVGDGKDVAHKKSLENGGGNSKSNVKVEDRSKNRGWRRGSASYNPDK
jgi:hypothetical protein